MLELLDSSGGGAGKVRRLRLVSLPNLWWLQLQQEEEDQKIRRTGAKPAARAAGAD
jgi:hypothetical protein